MNAADKAEFEIVGTLSRFNRDRGGKVVHLQIRVRGIEREKLLDLKYFGAMSADAFRVGDRVRVVGEPGTEKLLGTTEQGRNGRTYDKWIPMLVARRIEYVEGAQATIPGTNDNARPAPDDDIPF